MASVFPMTTDDSRSIVTLSKKGRDANRAPAYVGILFLMGLPVLASHPAQGQTEGAPAVVTGLSQRGGLLQADIVAKYKELRSNQALRFAPDGGNDVTPLVLKYIPFGATMEQAVAILHAAGYYLSTTPDGTLYARANLGGTFPNFKRSGLEIALKWSSDDAHTVSELHAEIFRRPTGGDLK
jgi:hypothetical protein